MMIKKIFFLFLVVFSINANAQKDFIGINSFAIPPFSNRIDEIISNTNVTSFLLNKTSQPLTVKLFLSIKKEGETVIRTSENYAMANPLSFLPNENKLIDFSQFASLKESDITILPEAEKLGLSKIDLIRTRKLPEGNYEICLDVYDYTGADIEPWNTPNVGCARMDLASYEVPQIIDINGQNCGEKITTTNPQFVSISWLKPAGFIGLLEYEIEIVEVFPNNREFNDAIFTTTKPVFLTEKTNSNLFVINLIHQPLKQGTRYVFRVKAIDPEEKASFRNNGYSEVCSFIYGDVAEEVAVANISSNLIYPLLNDTVPFANPPILIKYAPYLQDIEKLTCQYTIKENQQIIREFEVELDAPSGLLDYFETENGGIDVNEETVKQIILGKYGDSSENNLFERGKVYSIDTKLDFKYKNNPIIQSVNNQTVFTYGMPSVKLSLLNNMPDTGMLDFKISFPNKPNFPIADFNNVGQLEDVYQFERNVFINEKAFIEVSADSSFDSVWYVKVIPFKKSFDITNPAVYILTDEIYSDIDFNLRIKQTGNWYARLKWLKDINVNPTNAESYYTSSPLKFTLDDSVDRSSTNCLAGDCMFPPVPMNERFSVDSLKIGMELKIGHHTLKVTTITKNSVPFSGEGVIKINPFPGIGGVDIPVKVKFRNISFKSDFRVFQGNAESVDGSGFLTDKSSSLIGSFLADSMENKNNLKTFIQNAGIYIENQGDEATGMPMPIGFVDNKYAGTTYKMAIANISFTPENALMNIVLGVNNSTLGNHLDFFAQDVCLRSTGFSVSKILLKAIGNREINIGSSKKLVLLGASDFSETQSHIEWDCNGFKNLNLKGYVEIDSSILKQENGNNKSLVRAGFDINIKSWNDFVVDLNLSDSFQIVGLPKWSFTANTLTLDLSNNKNPIGIVFPEGYQGIKSNDWQGVYFKNIVVKTPAGFKDKTNQTERLTFNIQNLLIDRTGVSVYIRNNNLLPISKGEFGNWAVSLDLIEIKILSSAFQYGKIDGKLRVPIDKSKDFNYSMVIDYQVDGNNNSKLSYLTSVSNITKLEVPMWKSQFNVLPNSHAKLYFNSNDSVYAELKINGTLTIDAKLPKIGPIEFKGIGFQDFIVRSSNTSTLDSSFISVGHISFASEQKKAGGFPVNIKDFKMVRKSEMINGEKVSLTGLQIELDVNLKMGINTFAGATNFNLWAKVSKQDGILDFEYHDFQIDSIGIYGKTSVLEIQGGLKFFDEDPTYGNGLKGNLSATFTPGIGLGVVGYFGSVTQNNKSFDYWGVFGSVTLSQGIPILAAFEIAGFGGGAYNNMEIVLPPSPPMSRTVNFNSTDLIPILKPKFDIFGFRATLFAQSFPGGKSWKASLSLGAEIKKTDFSLQKITLQGNMWMMAPPEKPNEQPMASLWAGAMINYDFVQEQFDGNFTFYVNKEIMDGVSVKGIQANDRAGTILMHYSSSKWFVYAGTPADRCGIKLTSPDFNINGYFVMGTVVPGIPALPQKILNVINVPISSTRSSEIGTGQGFGFGAEFGLNTGTKKFLFMSASLDLLVGMDMSLLKYDQASCDGLSMSQIGLDGWYARGQMYAYAEGIINADIDVWFYQGKVEIMNCKAGMVLEGGLPNPSWMKGTIAGHYRLFGGALEGPFKYDAQIGKECRPAYLQESPIIDMKIIADVKPTNNTNGFDIFEKPEILCNFKLNDEIKIDVMDNNGVKKVRVFRPKVTVKLKERNIAVASYTRSFYQNNLENIIVELNSGLAYKPYQQYTLELTEFFEEKINNVWAVAKNSKNEPVRSVRNEVFNTGGVPATIQENVISEMTPAVRENFFMKKTWTESGSSSNVSFSSRFTHNLKQYYFLDSIYTVSSNFNLIKVKALYYVRFTNLTNVSDNFEQEIQVYQGGTTITSYQAGNLSVLKNGVTYKLEIIRKPQVAQNVIYLGNATKIYNTQYVNKLNNDNFKINLKTNSFSGDYKSNKTSNNEFVLFTSYFNTSKFNNMVEKVAASKLTLNLQRADKSIGYIVENNLDEPYDETEWNKNVFLGDVIQSGVSWYKTWDSMRVCMDYLNQYNHISMNLPNINVSWSSNISNDIVSINPQNTKILNYNKYLWKLNPLNNVVLTKKSATNSEFISASKTKNSQSFVSSFEKEILNDRIKIDNNIIEVIALHNQAKSYFQRFGVTNLPKGYGKIITPEHLAYLNTYLNGSFSTRFSQNMSYHQLLWYYYPFMNNSSTRQISNYSINSLINK